MSSTPNIIPLPSESNSCNILFLFPFAYSSDMLAQKFLEAGMFLGASVMGRALL